ncbi:MAG: aldehyde dehydrogenase family protein [Firmicutes bacterium]|nr:aldehyde dehydrogenase family protein [Bacillota bacterium]
MDIAALVQAQRDFFNSGYTQDVEVRRAALIALQAALRRHEAEIAAALHSDLGKGELEAYMTETGIVLEELRLMLKKLNKWVRPRRVATPLALFPGQSRIYPQPYGVTLIISPWNYPLQLCLMPLIGALAAGNTAIIKPSAYAPATSALVARLIGETFQPEYVAVVEGGRAENTALLNEKFDFIFFTGSTAVGKVVMEAAAKHLTPLVLELGGKSPVLVAPDYILLPRGREEELIAAFRTAVAEQLPQGLATADYPHIVSRKHYDRVCGLLECGQIALGGGTDAESLRIEPTLLTDVPPDSPLMQEEIFGPLLPLIPYDSPDEALEFIRHRPRPLALYYFGGAGELRERALQLPFGGGCVNDTIMHLANSRLPFGGIGASGLGCYHGKESFLTFSAKKGIYNKSNWLDLPMRYRPYTAEKLRLIRRFLR